MGPRWKGKSAEAKALAEPMSMTISQLQSSLIESNARGQLLGSVVLLAAEPELAQLLTQTYFGQPMITAEKDKQWFQLGMEEAFYLCHSLKCLKLVGQDDCVKDDGNAWQSMMSKNAKFPEFYKAYSHLRARNWVVGPGSKYGVDFVAYRHHPALVHSEFAVLVLSGDNDGRLRDWADVHGKVRLCGNVAKTLLVLNVSKNGGVDDLFPSCLEGYFVEEHTITRWSPEQSREGKKNIQTITVKDVP